MNILSGSETMHSKLKRVLVPLTGGVHWIGGIQYTRNILRSLELLKAKEKPEIIVSINSRNTELNLDEEFTRFPGVLVDGYGKLSRIKSITAGLFNKITGKDLFKKQLLSDSCTVAFPVKNPEMPGNFEKIFWIPDFQYRKYPEFFPVEDIKKRDRIYDKLLTKANWLVLSSEAVKKDFYRYFGEYKNVNVRVLKFYSWFKDEEYNFNPLEICNKYNIPERYVYLPNQFFAHKKHDTVFKAIGELKRSGMDIHLVCTGSDYDYRGEGYYKNLQKIIEDYDLDKNIHRLGIIDRVDQIQIYRQAAFVVQPSKSEGWSTSVEDARTLGKDILMSDIETHKEQAPEYGSFFRLEDVDDCADKIRKLYLSAKGYDPAREQNAREKSRELCREYARTFVKIMEEANG